MNILLKYSFWSYLWRELVLFGLNGIAQPSASPGLKHKLLNSQAGEEDVRHSHELVTSGVARFSFCDTDKCQSLIPTQLTALCSFNWNFSIIPTSLGLSSLTQLLIATCAVSTREEKLQTCQDEVTREVCSEVWHGGSSSWLQGVSHHPTSPVQRTTPGVGLTQLWGISSCVELVWMWKQKETLVFEMKCLNSPVSTQGRETPTYLFGQRSRLQREALQKTCVCWDTWMKQMAFFPWCCFSILRYQKLEWPLFLPLLPHWLQWMIAGGWKDWRAVQTTFMA